MSYYILSVDSLEEALASMDSNKTFSLSINPKEMCSKIDILNAEDFVVVYKRKPYKKVHSILKVVKKENSVLYFTKIIETGIGSDISNLINIDLDSLDITDINQEDYSKILDLLISKVSNENSVDEDPPQSKERALGGYNKIYYGAPGCGKSRYISDMLKKNNVKKNNIMRVTFHPEYMNCDFVGQILPSISSKIDPETGKEKEVVSYKFNPGPFSKALDRAKKTTDMVYLIIEEINRGNASAIFGDLFQLLDRVKDLDEENYSASEYPVCNPYVYDFLVRVGDKKYLVENAESNISIPSNLTILATMNSSDQNVFTLDTAFKRRWLFEQISNDIEKDTNHKYKMWYVPGTDVTWEKFLTKLNSEILDYKIHNQTNEDKRLGKYFVSKDCLSEEIVSIEDVQDAANNFAYKVLEYVWNDVCKIGREDWFDLNEYKTLEAVIEAFTHPKKDESPLKVFRNIDFKA